MLGVYPCSFFLWMPNGLRAILAQDLPPVVQIPHPSWSQPYGILTGSVGVIRNFWILISDFYFVMSSGLFTLDVSIAVLHWVRSQAPHDTCYWSIFLTRARSKAQQDPMMRGCDPLIYPRRLRDIFNRIQWCEDVTLSSTHVDWEIFLTRARSKAQQDPMMRGCDPFIYPRRLRGKRFFARSAARVRPVLFNTSFNM